MTLTLIFPNSIKIFARNAVKKPSLSVQAVKNQFEADCVSLCLYRNLSRQLFAGFVANHVPLEEGENTITVTATDTEGNTAAASINVTALTAGDYIRITADTESGISPLETTLRVEGSFSFTEEPNLTHDGPGEVEFLENPNDNEFTVSITIPGIYYFTAEVEYQGETYADTVAIQVLSEAELDALLRAKWEGMKAALAQNDIDSAVSYFDDFSKDSYGAIFNALTSQQRLQITQEFSDIKFIRIMKNSAEYDIRTVRDDKEYSFYLLFVRDEDGLWKIRSF